MYIYVFKKGKCFTVLFEPYFFPFLKIYLWTLLIWTFFLAFLTKQNSTWILYSLDLPARLALWFVFFSSTWTLKNNPKIAPVLVMAYFLAVNLQPVLSHVQLFAIAWTAGYSPAPGSCPWRFSRQEYWSGLPCSLLQGIFPTQGSNPGLPHWRQILYSLSHQGSPRILEWVV